MLLRLWLNLGALTDPLISNTISWCSNNVEGQQKRAVVLGIVIGFGNLNGIGMFFRDS